MTNVNICRLCLTNSTIQMYELTENCEILKKLITCLSIQITLEKYLPKNVCEICLTKIEDIHQYRERIIISDSKLKESFTASKLKDDYDTKENNSFIDIKNEAANKNYAAIKEEKSCDEDELVIDENDRQSSDGETLASIKLTESHSHTTCDVNKKDINNVHNKVLIHKCLTCFSFHETRIELKKHYENNHGHQKEIGPHYIVTGENNYECIKCHKVYNQKKDVKRHILITHTDKRPFSCNICGRTYKTIYEMLLHDRAHNQTKKLMCKHGCGYTTAYVGVLKQHEKRHRNEFKYICEVCNKGFFVKSWYDQHQNIHKGLKPFTCDICGAAFPMDRYLSNHRAKHPKATSVNRYVCVHCSLPFNTKYLLTQHMSIHGISPTKKCLCDTCGKVLKDKSSLRRHELLHQGVKPYNCSICNKNFIKKYNLQVHERAHSREKTCPCLHCDKAYMRQSTLNRHMKRKHNHVTTEKDLLD